MPAEEPNIAAQAPAPDRWALVRRWLLGAASMFAVALAAGAVLTGRPLYAIAAWTFGSLPIVYLAAAAIRGKMGRLAGVGIAASLAVIVAGSTVVAVTSCGQRLEPGSDLTGCDLSGEDLTGLDLSGTDLSDADLSGATLARTLLDQADLTEANLQDAVFDRTSLKGVTLERADLRNTDLTRAILRPATLEGAVLDGANLEGVELVDVSLRGASLRGANLTGADLSDADMSGVVLEGATLDRATLIGVTGLPDEALAQAVGVASEDLAGALTEREIRLELRDEILAAMKAACGGRRAAEAAPYPQGTFHPMVILDDKGRPGSETDRAVDLGWEPMAARFAQLVACVGKQQHKQIESCPYTSGTRFATINRVQNRRAFRVVEASTGRTVLRRHYTGTLPKPCPPTHVFSTVNPVDTFSGSSIGFGKIKPSLARLVE